MSEEAIERGDYEEAKSRFLHQGWYAGTQKDLEDTCPQKKYAGTLSDRMGVVVSCPGILLLWTRILKILLGPSIPSLVVLLFTRILKILLR
jgi:hypothetical protein